MKYDYPTREQMLDLSDQELGEELALQVGELVIKAHDMLVSRGWASTYAAKGISVIGAGLLRDQNVDYELVDIIALVDDMVSVEVSADTVICDGPRVLQ